MNIDTSLTLIVVGGLVLCGAMAVAAIIFVINNRARPVGPSSLPTQSVMTESSMTASPSPRGGKSAAPRQVDPATLARVQNLILSGRIEEAAQIIAEIGGVDMTRARSAVGNMEKLMPILQGFNGPMTVSVGQKSVTLDDETTRQIVALMRDGREEEAVALCQQKTGSDLATCQKIVKSLSLFS